MGERAAQTGLENVKITPDICLAAFRRIVTETSTRQREEDERGYQQLLNDPELMEEEGDDTERARATIKALYEQTRSRRLSVEANMDDITLRDNARFIFTRVRLNA